MGLYKYRPGLFPDRILDDAAGIVLAEFLFVSSLAILLVTLVPAWWGSLVGSAIVTPIEVFFHGAGILEYHGWRIWYTTVGFIIYFLLVRAFLTATNRHGLRSGWMRTLTCIGIVLTINGLFEVTQWAAMTAKISLSILPNPDNNQALLRFLWHITLRAPLTYWVIAGRGFSWRVRLLLAAVTSLTLTTLAVSVGLRQLSPPWSPASVVLEQTLFMIIAAGALQWIDHLRNDNRHPLT